MMKWTSRSKRNSVAPEKSPSKQRPLPSTSSANNAIKPINENNENVDSSNSLYSNSQFAQSSGSMGSFSNQSTIPNSESMSSFTQGSNLVRTQSIYTLANDNEAITGSFKKLSVNNQGSGTPSPSPASSSRPFNYETFDDTVLKTAWINKGSNISNWNNISPDAWKIYKAELKGSTLSLYKMPSDLNIKSFDPRYNQPDAHHQQPGLRHKRLSTMSSRSNLKSEIKTPTTPVHHQPVADTKTSRLKLKYRSEVYPHPDLELNDSNSIISGSLESVCHTIIFNTLDDDNLSYNLLLILPLFGDMKESLKCFIEYAISFTAQRQSKSLSGGLQKIQISSNTDYAITQRLGLVVSTIVDTFPGMLLDEDLHDLLEKLLVGIAQHDEQFSDKLSKLFSRKDAQLKELTNFKSHQYDPNGSLSLTNIESFFKLDASDLAQQINTIDLKFNRYWNPKNDPSLLYEVENLSYSRLNPLVFNSTTNIHYLGRILINHLFGSPECRRSEIMRAKVIAKWVEIGSIFDKIGDMVSWLAIATTICSVPVLRLRKTWSAVDEHTLKVISTEWAPVVFELDRRTMISEASHRSSYHVIAPQGLGQTYSRENVVPYFGDLSVKFTENSTLKTCEKKVQRVKISFNRWDDYLQNVKESEGLSQQHNKKESPELIRQLINALSNHVQLPPLTQYSVMELSLATELDNFGTYRENKVDSRTPLVTGSYLPTLFSEIIPTYRLFNQNVLIGASGFSTPDDNPDKVSIDGFHKITGINDIDIRSHQLNQSLPPPSKQHTLLKSVRDIFNIGSDAFHVEDELIFKSLNNGDELKSSRPVSVVLENPSSKRLSKISNHRLSQFSASNRHSALLDTDSDEMDVFAGLDSSDLLNSLTKPLNVVLKAGTFEKMIDVLVLTSNVFSKKIEKKDIDSYLEKSNLLDNQFLKLKMNNGVYTSTFFSTYKSFASTPSLLESLTKRFVGARSCALSIQKFNADSCTSDAFPNWLNNVSLDDAELNWKYVGNIQIGILEALLILVSSHYNDFTDDLKNKAIFVELLKIIDNEIVVVWKDILTKFEESVDLKTELNEIYNALSNLYKRIRKNYIKKCYRPLELFPRHSPNLGGLFKTDANELQLPDNFRDAELFVDRVDSFINGLLQKTTTADWIYVFQIMEGLSSRSLTSFFKYSWKGSKDEEQLEILNLFSWVENLYGENVDDRIIDKLPPPVKLLFEVHQNLEGLFKSKISDINVSSDTRTSRMVSVLQILTISRLRMKSAGLFNSDPTRTCELSPHVPSFIESSITQAIVSPQSRLYVDAWTHAASVLRNEPIKSIDQVLDMLPNFEVDDLTSGLTDTLTPCVGWFMERLLEISNYVPNMSIENSKLINFDKRRFTYNCISNIIDMNSKHEQNKTNDSQTSGLFGILLQMKHFQVPDFAQFKEASFRENTDPKARLFKPLIAKEFEKIQRDAKKKETLETQERDFKRSQLLSQASASLVVTNELPLPNEQQQQQRKGRQSSSSSVVSQVSPSKGVGKRLGGFFKSVRPFSISVAGGWSGAPDRIIHPDDLPDVNNVDLSGRSSKPHQEISLGKAKPLFVHSNIEGFFKIVSDQGGEEFYFQATSNYEAQSWISALNLAKRYSYLSKDANGMISTKVFGVPIADVCEREGTVIPRIAERLLQEIEVRGLDETGLYRVPGSVGSINLLKKVFDEGGDFTLEDDRWFEVNTLAGCFKSYLRELPESPFTAQLLPSFVDATKHGDLISNLKILICQLPVPNYHLLKRLFEHLNKVILHSNQNRMDAVNLAIVFSMSFLNNDSLGASMGTDLGALQTILQTLIKNPELVFTEDEAIA